MLRVKFIQVDTKLRSKKTKAFLAGIKMSIKVDQTQSMLKLVKKCNISYRIINKAVSEDFRMNLFM